MSQLDQAPENFGVLDISERPDLWATFLHVVLEITVTAYLMLKQEGIARSTWKEDTFTINIERCMKQVIRKQKLPLSVISQRNIYTPEMMLGETSPQKAVRLDLKIWNWEWYCEDDIYFAWECKLIVDKAKEDKHQRLTREYITDGIIRFLNEHWKYAESVDDAGILGYVLYGEVAQVVKAINRRMINVAHHPEAPAHSERERYIRQSSSKLSSADFLKLSNSMSLQDFQTYESQHNRSFCDRSIHLYHFFLTFDFVS